LVKGFKGVAPDTVVQAASPWHRFPGRYFSLREYLLGYKGMLSSVYVILPQKSQSAAESGNKNLNDQHARRLIFAELVIGLLKGRWSRLRKLPLPYRTNLDYNTIMDWVAACAHNIWIALREPSPEPAPAERAVDSVLPVERPAVLARAQVQQDVWRFMLQNGLYHR